MAYSVSEPDMIPTECDGTTSLLQAVFDMLPVGIGLLDAGGALILANPAMRRFMPVGVMPSADDARYGRWRGYHADGRRIERTDYPGARALRGEIVVPGVEFLYREEDGRERWVRVAAMPLRDDRGQITGAVAVTTDIDDAKQLAEALHRSEERQAYLLGLSDALRSLADPAEIQAVAARILGEHLGVTRVLYGEVSTDGAELLVARSYVVDDAPALAGRYRMADFGATLLAALRVGHTIAVPDVGAAAELSAAERAAYGAFGVSALAGVPLVKHGRFVANLTVHHAAPRAWSPDDLALIEATAERTWAAVERARAEATARASQVTLHAFYDTAPFLMGVGEIDGDNLIAVSANRKAAEFFARPPAAIPGRLGSELGTPAAVEAFWLAHLRKSQQEGVPVKFEYLDVRATGNTWLSATVAVIGTGPTGRPQYSFIAEDIGERKRSEAARRESEARLHAIANLVPDLLWSTDAEGKTDWYNQRWLEYSGQTPAQSLGDGWLEAIHPDDRETSIARFQAAAARGEPLRHEHRIRSAGGEYRWFLVQARPERDEAGSVVRWLGAATDIDDLKRAEASLQQSHAELDRRVQERTAELQQLSEARQDLLQRLVTVQEDERRRIARELHDSLGQFLSALNLRLSILEQTAGVASPVLEEIEQLRPAVQQIDRELDRLTMELRPPALDDFGLPAALRNYAAAWARLANIPVEVYVTGLDTPSPALPASSPARPRLSPEVETSVYRIVQEALTNVLKHAQAMAVSVIVERRRTSLSVIVEDNGIGFDPDAAPGQPDSSGAARLHLGLLGMQERAALVGGSFQVESAPGAGTTIYVQIPCA